MNEMAPGLAKEKMITVTEDLTAKHLGSGSVLVLATPSMIALMENVAQESVQPFLPDGQTTVGVHVDVRHLAATPLGLEVRVRSEVLSVAGRLVTFKVEAFDAVDKCGEGVHERMIIDLARFQERLDRKRVTAARS